MKMDSVLEKEIRKTYADCQSPYASFEVTSKIRRLDWKADEPVSGEDVREALNAACVSGYNEFDPVNVADAILTVDPEAKVYIAREGSVCLYIKTEHKKMMIRALKDEMADEQDIQNDGTIRFWWD